MNKKLLFFLFFLSLLLIGISSEAFSVSKNNLVVSNPHRIASGAAQTNGLAIGYSTPTIASYTGKNSSVTLKAAIEIPASTSALYAGKTLTKIKIGVSTSGSLSNVKVFLTKDLNGTAFYTQAVSASTLTTGWNEITLTTPYTINASDDFYIGYTLTTSGGYPIGLDGETTNNYASNVKVGSNAWTTLSSGLGVSKGNLSILGVVEGSGLPQYNVSLISLSLPTPYIKTGNTFNISGVIRNIGEQPITSFNVRYKVGDNAEVVSTISGVNIGNYQQATFSIPNVPSSVDGEIPVTATIENLNGTQADESPNDNTITSAFVSVSTLLPRKIVAEEATGTWCGYCVRGIVFMSYMKKTYPDNFIGIAVHNGDPMVVSDYDSGVGTYISGYPSVILDRNKVIDPSKLETYYNTEIKESLVAVHIDEVAYTGSNKASVNIKTSTTAAVSLSGKYKLAFVVVENNVSGTTSGYAQHNYYAGGSLGTMGGFENQPSTIPATDMVYQDVARSISSFRGSDGIVPASLSTIPAVNTSTLTLTSKITNKDNIEIIALLIDGNTGEIVNADKIDAAQFITSGINNPTETSTLKIYSINSTLYINEDFSNAVVYDVTGKTIGTLKAGEKSVNNISKGIYLVKLTLDGKTYIQKTIVY